MSIRKKLTDQVNRYFRPTSDSRSVLANVIELIGEEFETERASTRKLFVESTGVIAKTMDKYFSGPKKVRIHRLDKDLPLPNQANPYDAGWDVYAAETVELKGGEAALISLGIIVEAPKNYHFQLHIRSSLAYKNHCRLENSVGIIDSAYCGPKDVAKALFKFEGPPQSSYKISKGDRIAQLVLVKNQQIVWDEQEPADFAGESRGGYGSSGK